MYIYIYIYIYIYMNYATQQRENLLCTDVFSVTKEKPLS